MAAKSIILMIVSILLASATLCFSQSSNGGFLSPQFYARSCPQAQQIVNSVVAKAVAKEPRMAASLLRLHFHDCFVQGCDASLLLDTGKGIISEKGAAPNNNTARGFNVVDEIKSAVEKACPQTVSCADILALAARDSTVLAGGPSWVVPLGRRDSRTASFNGANNDIPAPNNTFQTILSSYTRVGLDIVDLVTLSGSHTIGFASCTNFRQRLYNQSGNGQPDFSLDQSYAGRLRTGCPRSGGDRNLFKMDFISPAKFDNNYFKHILNSKALLNSDEVLATRNRVSLGLVQKYEVRGERFGRTAELSILRIRLHLSLHTSNKNHVSSFLSNFPLHSAFLYVCYVSEGSLIVVTCYCIISVHLYSNIWTTFSSSSHLILLLYSLLVCHYIDYFHCARCSFIY